GVRLIREIKMSLWVLVPLSFFQLGVGGIMGFGLIFLSGIDRGEKLSDFNNNVCVALWYLYVFSVFTSFGLVIYFYLNDSQASYYLWYLTQWVVLAVLVGYWRIASVKLA
ncbi:hypothetical protein, partial [Vibrio parahaemolyticus]|uniref:hypothetical protein n=1 Tax=Vibrio parahaemolyticus TaxID=670 RepID=UPI001EE9EABF